MVYLVEAPAYDNAVFMKVGYTGKIGERMRAYACHCPGIRLLETAITYKKTKHELEKEIHKEIVAKGYEFYTVHISGLSIKTEWFYVPADKVAEFRQLGLSQFKACKNRVIQKVIQQEG